MITSVDNPRVREVVRLRKARERRREGVLLAEGVREVERAVAGGLVVRQVFHAPELLPDWAPPGSAGESSARVGSVRGATPPGSCGEVSARVGSGRDALPPGSGAEPNTRMGSSPDAAPPGSAGAAGAPIGSVPESASPGSAGEASIDVQEVSARVLARMTYRDDPEGVLAVCETPTRAIPTGATLLVVAVGIEKPGNLGAIARSADAAGADGIIVADGDVDPWNPNAIRASTGSVFTLPIVEATRDEVAKLEQQKLAAVLGAKQRHSDVDLTVPTAFLIGAEDTGLDATWREVADLEVEIPMSGTAADSLNASAAAAVLLFEAVRQRGLGR